MKVIVEMEVTLDRISTLLCSAFEGGSNYWYMIAAQKKPTTFEFRSFPDQIFPHIDYPLNEGGNLRIETLDKEEVNGQKSWTLNLSSIEKGLKVFADKYPHHWADFLNENDDATTGDVFLQCCLFGEVVFG